MTDSDQSHTLTTSSSLISGLQAYNDQRWKDFVSAYTPLISFWIAERVRDEHARQDILQDCLISAAKGIVEFERSSQKGSFRRWLKTIAQRRVVDHIRLTCSAQAVSDGRFLENLSFNEKSEELTQAENLAFEELKARAMELIRASMAPNTWDMFWMSVVEQVPTKEVAAKFGVSESGVRMARGRVLSRLRELLPDEISTDD